MAMWDSYAITDHTSAHSEGQCSNSLLKASLAVASRFFCFSSDTEEVLYQNFKWLIFKETLVNGLLTARQCQWCLCSGASMLLSQRVGVCSFCFRLIQNALFLPSISTFCAGEMEFSMPNAELLIFLATLDNTHMYIDVRGGVESWHM